jgi:hypothetical protein
MKKISTAKSAPARRSLGEGGFFNPRALIGFLLCFVGVLVALFAFGAPTRALQAQGSGHESSKLQPGIVKISGLVSRDNPASGTWSVTGSLNTARDEHTATLLPNGKVLVAGGIDIGSTNTVTAELYDPASGSWTATGNLNAPRSYFTATLLPNGKVLVAGGDSKEGERSSTELYDPASGTWTFTGNLNVARQSHTATLLPNGKVLVAGGYNAIDQIIDSVELYDPATPPAPTPRPRPTPLPRPTPPR